MDSRIVFEEKQHFNRYLILGILLVVNIRFFLFLRNASISGFDYALAEGGNAVLVEFGISALLGIFLFSIRLDTRLSKEALEVRLFPFQPKYKRFSWDQFAQVSLRQYNPLLEYGGWGLRGLGSNKAINIGGNYGIQLVFHDSSRLLIGTQKKDELQKALGRLSVVAEE